MCADCNVLYNAVTRSRSPSPPRSSRLAHPPSPPRSSRTAQRRERGGPHLRSKSLTSQLDGGRGAPGDARYLALRLENTEKKLSDTQLLLHLKVRAVTLTRFNTVERLPVYPCVSFVSLTFQCKELDELRSAHNRRLERLKALQSEHKLLKRHSGQLEDDLYG